MFQLEFLISLSYPSKVLERGGKSRISRTAIESVQIRSQAMSQTRSRNRVLSRPNEHTCGFVGGCAKVTLAANEQELLKIFKPYGDVQAKQSTLERRS